MVKNSCDNCGQEFGGPLDQEEHKGKKYDLCAPCRALLNGEKDKAKDKFFKKV